MICSKGPKAGVPGPCGTSERKFIVCQWGEGGVKIQGLGDCEDPARFIQVTYPQSLRGGLTLLRVGKAASFIYPIVPICLYAGHLLRQTAYRSMTMGPTLPLLWMRWMRWTRQMAAGEDQVPRWDGHSGMGWIVGTLPR